jgi:hypothetical protein
MKIGQTFSTWLEFENELKKYRNTTFQPFFAHKHAKSIEQINERSPNLPRLKSELKYWSVEIQCIHFGTYKSQAKEVSYKFDSCYLSIKSVE